MSRFPKGDPSGLDLDCVVAEGYLGRRQSGKTHQPGREHRCVGRGAMDHNDGVCYVPTDLDIFQLKKKNIISRGSP